MRSSQGVEKADRVGKERLAGWPRPPPDTWLRKPVFFLGLGQGSVFTL